MGCYRSEQGSEGIIYELFVIISLEGFNGKVELILYRVAEVGYMGSYLGFVDERKRPTKVSKIIE